MELEIMNLIARDFTTTEQLDLGTIVGEYGDIHENRAQFPFCTLEAVGDNLYRVSWEDEAALEFGPFAAFTSLKAAGNYVMAMTTTMFS